MTRRGWSGGARGTVLAGLALAALQGCTDAPTAPATRTASPWGEVSATPVAPVAPVMFGDPGTSGTAVDINDNGVVVGTLRRGTASVNVAWHPSGAVDTAPLATIVGIGNDGMIVGTTTRTTLAGQTARWHPLAGLIEAPLYQGRTMIPTAVSSGGAVIGYADLGAVTVWPQTRPLVWVSPSSPFPIGTDPNWKYMTPLGMGGNGAIVGSVENIPPYQSRAFLWTNAGGLTIFGTPNSKATAVNGGGTIVGELNGQAVRLYAGSTLSDVLLPGVASSSTRAINDKGEIAVNTGGYAYLLRGTTVFPLSSLGGCCAYANAVNEKSQVVGWATDAAGVPHPAMWDVNAVPPVPPIVASAGGPYFGGEGFPVRFLGSATGGLPPIAFTWSFGDGASLAGQNVTHAYADNGSYAVTLDATDGTRNASAATTATIFNVPPVVTLATGAPIFSGETYTLRGRVDDPGIHDAPWSWTARDLAGSALETGTLPAVPDSVRVPMALTRAGAHLLELRVTDKDGGTGSAMISMQVLRLPVPMTVAPSNLKAAQRGNGLLTVTLFATPRVDPASIVVASVRLADSMTVSPRGNDAPMAALEDVNGDGVRELVLKFRRAEARDWEALTGTPLVLRADLADGRQIEGRWLWPTIAAR